MLEACREPVSQLAKIAGRIAENPEDYTLDALWSDVCSFARDHLDTERFGRNLLETVEDRMDLDNGSAVSSNISAEVGIRLLSSMMSGLEVPPSDKFREGIDVGDGVFVGGVSSRPLDQFDAIRIIGLTENRLPSPPKEDPILSDAQRERLLDRGYALPRSTEAPENRMKDLYSMINSCGREVVFSTASRDADGQKRAPSSLFVDVCISSGLSGGEPPGASVLERLMDRDEAHREQFPLTNRFRCTRGNRNHVRVPASWKDGPRPALSLERITSLLSEYDERNPYADLFGDLSSADLPDDLLHGMTEDKPISPSRIKTLAQCPHQYLLENVLYYDERSEPQETTELDPLTFGSLVHDTAEEIYEHVFEGADPDPEEHEEEIEAIIRSQWDDMMRTYELVGEISEQRQWERFQSTIRTLIRRDREQERLGRELIMEESIGFDEAIQHSSGLFVRGTLDRVEVDELDNAYIWDIKSGSKKDKNKYILYLDPQVGIYQLLLRNSERFGDQAVYRVGFLYPSSGSGYERTFDRQDDGDSFSLDELEANTDRLMNLIKSLFDEQVFPRTFDKNHCNYCQFQELCGDESREHAREFIENRNPDWMDAYQEFHD